MSLKMKLNIINKHEYEENVDYREIIIKIPRELEKLKKDFEYLGLDYNNLSIQDTNILNCEVIDSEDPAFSASISMAISNIIERAKESGWTTPYQDIKSMYAIIKSLGNEDRDKLLAVLEIKREQISNMKDAVKYCNNLECFEFYNNIGSNDQYAQRLIDNQEVSLEDVIDYINLEEMGEAYVNGHDGIFTEQGLIFETEPVDLKIQRQISEREEEEEFVD